MAKKLNSFFEEIAVMSLIVLSAVIINPSCSHRTHSFLHRIVPFPLIEALGRVRMMELTVSTKHKSKHLYMSNQHTLGTMSSTLSLYRVSFFNSKWTLGPSMWKHFYRRTVLSKSRTNRLETYRWTISHYTVGLSTLWSVACDLQRPKHCL